MGWVECDPVVVAVHHPDHQYRTVYWEGKPWPRYTLIVGVLDGKLQATVCEHVNKHSYEPRSQWPALLTTEILQMLRKAEAVLATSPQGVFAEESSVKGPNFPVEIYGEDEQQSLLEVVREAYDSGISLGTYWLAEGASFPLSPGHADWDWSMYVRTQRRAWHLLTEAEQQFWNMPEVSDRPVSSVFIAIGTVLQAAGFSISTDQQRV